MLHRLLFLTIFCCLTTAQSQAQTWTKLTTATYSDMDLNDVYANGQNIFAVGYTFGGFTGHILRSANDGQTWDTLQPYGSGRLLKTIAFKDKDTGFIAGYGSVTSMLRTTDGGKNWKSYITDFNNAGINDLQFINDKYGFGSGYAYKQFSTGQVYKTVDGGNTWYYIDSINLGCLDTLPVDYIHMLDAQTGYGHSDFLGGKTIVKTTDSGNTWNVVYTHTTLMVGFHFKNVNDGIMVDVQKDVYKTTDGGKNWSAITTNLSKMPTLLDVDFMNQTTGVAVGDAGAIYLTNDGGTTWTKQTSPVNATYLRVRWHDNRAYAVARGGHVVRSEVMANSVNDVLTLREQLNVYPNPANDVLNISSYKAAYKNMEVVMTDMTGKVVATAKSNDGLVQLNTNNVAAGVYNIRITADGYTCSDKVQIAH